MTVVVKGLHDEVMLSRTQWRERLAAKDGAKGLQRGSNGMFGCKGRNSMRKSWLKRHRGVDIYEGKTAVSESLWLLQGTD